jgi:CIC family chloride channel protein
MAATFNIPIAAILLSVDLLLFELRPRRLIPLALACAMGVALRRYLLGSGPLFPMPKPSGKQPRTDLAGDLRFAGGHTFVHPHLVRMRLRGWFPQAAHPLDVVAGLGRHRHWFGGYFEPHALGVGYDVIDG